MAVVNTIDDTLAHPQDPGALTGQNVQRSVRGVPITNGDSIGSIYLLAEVPGSAKLDELFLEMAAVSGANDCDVGIYDVDGTEYDGDKLADGLDLTSVAGLSLGPTGIANRPLLSALLYADLNKTVGELAGHVMKASPAPGEVKAKPKYRIGLKLNAAATATVNGIARSSYRKTP